MRPPSERNFVPEAVGVDAPRTHRFNESRVMPWGVAHVNTKRSNTKDVYVPSLLESFTQANPMLASLPAHGAPNDVRDAGLMISGVMGHFNRSTVSATPGFKPLRGIGPNNMDPKKENMLVKNF